VGWSASPRICLGLRSVDAQGNWKPPQHRFKAIQQVPKSVSTNFMLRLHFHMLQSQLLPDFLDVATDIVKRSYLLLAWQCGPHAHNA